MTLLLFAFAIAIAGRRRPARSGRRFSSTWAMLGASYSAAQVPTGRLLRRSAHAEDRPSLFAAQFALSHACWLLTYPLAGWLGKRAACRRRCCRSACSRRSVPRSPSILWPAPIPRRSRTSMRTLPQSIRTSAGGARTHRHAFVIDDLHAALAGRGARMNWLADLQHAIYAAIGGHLGAFASSRDWIALATILPLGIVFGAVHALTPGHSKTLLASYLSARGLR